MKKTLIILCSAVALVGCDQNRGGAGNDSTRDTGFSSSRDRETTYPSSRTMNSGSLTNTNSATGAPAPGSGSSSSGTSGANGSSSTPQK